MPDQKLSGLADVGADLDLTETLFVVKGGVSVKMGADRMYRAMALEQRLDKTAAYTATTAEIGKTVRGDASAGALILKLPAAGVTDGDTITFKKSDTSGNRVTVQDNAGAADLAWLSMNRDWVMFAWWGGAWVAYEWNIQPLKVMFTSSGTSTKPPLVSLFDAVAFGGGAGGGSGRRGALGVIRGGGGGGTHGGIAGIYSVPASVHGTTEVVTIGSGGAGGTSVAADDTNGNAGVQGGVTTLGTVVRGVGGTPGGGGTNSAGGTAGSTAGLLAGMTIGSSNPGIAGSTGSGVPTTALSGVAGSGGGGGGSDASNTVRAGGNGGGGSNPCGIQAGGGTTGLPGVDVTDVNTQWAAGGGGGGAGSNTGSGVNGGAGGAPSGGGAGGGGGLNGFAGSVGGAGGRGELRLTWYFN